MLAEWSAECGNDAPTLIVPWNDPVTGARFFDLRAEPYDIAEIAEAEHNATLPALCVVECDSVAVPHRQVRCVDAQPS